MLAVPGSSIRLIVGIRQDRQGREHPQLIQSRCAYPIHPFVLSIHDGRTSRQAGQVRKNLVRGTEDVANRHCRHADAYHSCYALAGLSSAQHRNEFVLSAEPVSDPMGYAYAWMHSEAHPSRRSEREKIFEEEDTVEPIHPIYVIPFAAVEQTRAWFSNKEGF